jgi:hypothetical protein
MSERIVVDPVTRIEGHLRIEAQMDGQNIAQAYSSGTSVRGLEIILRGRDPRDAWAFAQRICGVCTLVHGMASVRAVEDAQCAFFAILCNLEKQQQSHRQAHSGGALFADPNVGREMSVERLEEALRCNLKRRIQSRRPDIAGFLFCFGFHTGKHVQLGHAQTKLQV